MIIPFMLSSLIGMTNAQPVRIESCYVSTPVEMPQGDAGPVKYGEYSVRIRFADAAELPLSRVTFRLNDGTTVVDRGTFSPNVTIDRTVDLPATSADSCSVASVRFSNGVAWSDGR